MNYTPIILAFIVMIVSPILFVIGYYLGLEPEQVDIGAIATTTAIQTKKPVVVTPAKVAQFFSDCGINGADHALVRDMLLNEEPQSVDITAVDQLSDIVDEYQTCLMEAEIINAYKNDESSINKMLINKANTGLAADKLKENYTNP